MEIRHQVWWFSSRTSFSRPWWRLVRETPWWMVGEWIAVIVIHWSQLAEYTYPIMNWLLFSIDYFFGLIIAFTVIVCTLCYWLLFLFMLSSLSSVSCQKGLQAFFFNCRSSKVRPRLSLILKVCWFECPGGQLTISFMSFWPVERPWVVQYIRVCLYSFGLGYYGTCK